MPPPGRLVLVTTSPRAVPGQLTHPAWQALLSADVLADDPEHPQLPAVREAGGRVRLVPAGTLAAAAVEAVGTGADAVALPQPGDEAVPAALVSAGVDVRLLAGSVDPPGARLLDVVAVMDRLRSPGGCPWDAAQTHASLKPYLLEEAYEAYAALEDADPVALREEMGDVLLQVAFHARLAEEAPEPWSIDDVAGDLVDKLVRRHPHVFDGAPAGDPEASWEALKRSEKGRSSVTEGVPLGQPALSLAAKLQRRGTRLGAPVPRYPGLGGELWELVRRCRSEGTDPEAALREVARRYRDELAGAERQVQADGGDPGRLAAHDWAQRWPAGA